MKVNRDKKEGEDYFQSFFAIKVMGKLRRYKVVTNLLSSDPIIKKNMELLRSIYRDIDDEKNIQKGDYLYPYVDIFNKTFVNVNYSNPLYNSSPLRFYFSDHALKDMFLDLGRELIEEICVRIDSMFAGIEKPTANIEMD